MIKFFVEYWFLTGVLIMCGAVTQREVRMRRGDAMDFLGKFPGNLIPSLLLGALSLFVTVILVIIVSVLITPIATILTLGLALELYNPVVLFMVWMGVFAGICEAHVEKTT